MFRQNPSTERRDRHVGWKCGGVSSLHVLTLDTLPREWGYRSEDRGRGISPVKEPVERTPVSPSIIGNQGHNNNRKVSLTDRGGPGPEVDTFMFG